MTDFSLPIVLHLGRALFIHLEYLFVTYATKVLIIIQTSKNKITKAVAEVVLLLY